GGLAHASSPSALARMADVVSSVPGVRSAGPLVSTFDDTVEVAGAGGALERLPIEEDAVSEGAIQALRLTPVSGRVFDHDDFDTFAPVTMVNDVLANRFWPNESAIGKSMTVIRSAPNALSHRQVVTVVGVVRTVPLNYALGDKPP